MTPLLFFSISPTLLLTTDGELWTAGSRGIAKYNRQSDSFIFFAYPQSFVATSSPHIPSMQQIGRNIWIGLHSAGIVRFGRDDRSWKLYTQNASDSSGPTSNQILVLRADRSGYLWIGSEAGLERYDPSTNEWKRPDSWGDTTLRIPQGWYIYGVTEDDFGGIWVSVSNRGYSELTRTMAISCSSSMSLQILKACHLTRCLAYRVSDSVVIPPPPPYL